MTKYTKPKRTMKFQYHGKECILSRIRDNIKTVEAKNLGKMADNGAQQFMIKVMPKTNEMIVSEEEILDILALTKEYDIMFSQPKRLPLTRGSFDHKILLENNSNPVNLRPYRYSSKKKDVIEKLCKNYWIKALFNQPIVLVLP
ncbi:hypothetical protein KY285_023587 [Solanum tuberosum]|nr:hypothetical protein KY289_023917 [Solanum tuberosum]KAH0675786.1 hypothetical protein KY285_023587 [Solanum tuberosum]